MPQFSIIVPVYNSEKFLDTCVQSLINQTFRDIEILLVDDGSTDLSPSMCDAYAEADPRIQVIHKKNGGLSDARNAGMSVASGEYLVFVDSDDYLGPDACTQYMRGVRAGADLIAASIRNWEGEQDRVAPPTGFQDGEEVSSRDYVIRAIQNRCFYATSFSNVYRREFMTGNNLYFRVGWIHEDWDMLPRLFTKEFRVVVLQYPAYNYVWRAQSITNAPVSEKRIHDSVGALSRWKQVFDDMKDREWQRWLYNELICTYFWNCRELKLSGWWIRGMGVLFCLHQRIGFRGKLGVIRFELQSVINRMTGKWRAPDKRLLATLDEPLK